MSSLLLDEIVELAGIQPAVRLCRTFGGRQVYIPEDMTETHPLALCMGYNPARELAKRYGRERLTIPAEQGALVMQRDRAMADDYTAGRSVSWLSRTYGVSRKWVTVRLDKLGIIRRALDDAEPDDAEGD